MGDVTVTLTCTANQLPRILILLPSTCWPLNVLSTLPFICWFHKYFCLKGALTALQGNNVRHESDWIAIFSGRLYMRGMLSPQACEDWPLPGDSSLCLLPHPSSTGLLQPLIYLGGRCQVRCHPKASPLRLIYTPFSREPSRTLVTMERRLILAFIMVSIYQPSACEVYYNQSVG